MFNRGLHCGYDHYAVTVRKKKTFTLNKLITVAYEGTIFDLLILQEVHFYTNFSYNSYLTHIEILLFIPEGCDE